MLKVWITFFNIFWASKPKGFFFELGSTSLDNLGLAAMGGKAGTWEEEDAMYLKRFYHEEEQAYRRNVLFEAFYNYSKVFIPYLQISDWNVQ